MVVIISSKAVMAVIISTKAVMVVISSNKSYLIIIIFFLYITMDPPTLTEELKKKNSALFNR